METKGYINTGKGEMLISYIQSFATEKDFAKAHPELSTEIWKKVNLKKVKPTVEDLEKK